MNGNSYVAECASYYATIRDCRARQKVVQQLAKLSNDTYVPPNIKADVDKLRAEMDNKKLGDLRRAYRDGAARRSTNVGSKKFPGLVCGSFDSLLQAEECFEIARAEEWEYLSMMGDIVQLPNNLCEILPKVTGMYCDSKTLCGFPLGLASVRCPYFPEYEEKVNREYEVLTSPITYWAKEQLSGITKRMVGVEERTLFIQKQMLDVKGQMIGITGQAVKSEEQNLAIDRGTQEQIRLLKEQNKYLLGAVQRLEARLAAVELERHASKDETPQGETPRCETPQDEQVSDTN